MPYATFPVKRAVFHSKVRSYSGRGMGQWESIIGSVLSLGAKFYEITQVAKQAKEQIKAQEKAAALIAAAQAAQAEADRKEREEERLRQEKAAAEAKAAAEKAAQEKTLADQKKSEELKVELEAVKSGPLFKLPEIPPAVKPYLYAGGALAAGLLVFYLYKHSKKSKVTTGKE